MTAPAGAPTIPCLPMFNTLRPPSARVSPAPDTFAARCSRVGLRLSDAAYAAWQIAQLECELALLAWHILGPHRGPAAHSSYHAALAREEAAARDFEEVCRVTGALAGAY
jgi:hypothetical protein